MPISVVENDTSMDNIIHLIYFSKITLAKLKNIDGTLRMLGSDCASDGALIKFEKKKFFQKNGFKKLENHFISLILRCIYLDLKSQKNQEL